MKCTIDAKNAKIFAKAVQSLSKFGSDLFIEAGPQSLQLRTLNATRSAVGTFKFNRSFFDLFVVEADGVNYCKVSMKASLAVFRNMKLVEQCELSIINDTSKFQVQLKCRLETVKNALIAILDEENITTAVSSGDTRNFVCASHKIFMEISNNFNTTEEEITLEIYNDCLTAKNYIEGSRVNERFMRSQLKLESTEFESYKVDQETVVTFCLKEFRAFLHFAEMLNENLVLNIDEAGSPIFLKIKHYDNVECLLVMSTLSPEDISFNDECRQSEIMNETNKTGCMPSQKRKINSSKTRVNSVPKTRKRLADASTLSNASTLFQFNGASSSASDPHSINIPRTLQTNAAGSSGVGCRDLPVQANSASSNRVTNLLPQPQPQSEVVFTFCDTEENREKTSDTEEVVPQSPRRVVGTQLRNIFSRCFESTYVPQEPSPNSEVYVPDSDMED